MHIQKECAGDVLAASRRVLAFVRAAPPHVRPWLRGIEAEAEHIGLEVSSANRRASARFLNWLLAGLPEDAEDLGDG